MKKLIHSFRNFALNLFFPQKCIGINCDIEKTMLCRECLAKIDFPTLAKHGNVFVATDYNDATAKKAVWLLKYRGVKTLAEPLAELIYQRIFLQHIVKEARPPLGGLASKSVNWLIIPVPLHKNRLQERGFNQSELIAKNLAEKIGEGPTFAVSVNVLYKTKETPSQVSVKNRKERLENIVGSFAIKNPELVAGKNIILIDDITTTGATMKEATHLLKLAGAKKIIAMAVARG